MQFKNILVPVDFSDPSASAVRLAANLARQPHFGVERVTLMHVVHISIALVNGGLFAGIREDLLRDARAELERYPSDLFGPDVAVVHRVEEGPPHARIAARVGPGGHDAVVMGTHGFTGLQRLALGSVCERTLRQVNVPVLVTSGPDEMLLDRILVPTDFSACSTRALQEAARLAAMGTGQITLVHVLDAGDPYIAIAAESLHGPVVDDLGYGREREQRRLQELGHLASQHIPAQIAHSVEVDEGFAPERIGAFAADHSLVVMGSHGRSGVERVLLGSVTERSLRHSPVPVLVVR